MRPTWNKYFMDMCDLVSTRGTCDRKRVGAVLVKDKRIISTGYNGSLPGLPHCDDPEEFWECTRCGIKTEEVDQINDQGSFWRHNYCNGPMKKKYGGHLMVIHHCIRTIHAERNAIAQAAKTGIPTDGATLFCNTFPCWDCFQLAVAAGIKKIIYKDPYDEDNMKRVEEIGQQLVPPVPVEQYIEN